ncbi:hypothetical protein HYV30_03725 [Candidatus Kaiserbacteria bacterium]|nr:hypothetical protein [Candidatus Kaiserbacteria bacterium]
MTRQQLPKVYRVLRTAVLASGGISIVTTVIILLAQTNWATGLIVAGVLGPFSIGGMAICGLSFLFYVAFYFARWKKQGLAFGKAILVIAVPAMSIYPLLNLRAEWVDTADKRDFLSTHVQGALSADNGDSNSIIKQKFFLVQFINTAAGSRFNFQTFQTDLENDRWLQSWYQRNVKALPCGEKPQYHVSPDGQILAVFLKRCDISGNFFCTGVVGYPATHESLAVEARGDVSPSQALDTSYFCDAKIQPRVPVRVATTTIRISGIKTGQSYEGNTQLVISVLISPIDIYDLRSTLVPEEKTPTTKEDGPYYDEVRGGYDRGGISMSAAGSDVQMPVSFFGIPPGSYHLKIDLLPGGSLKTASKQPTVYTSTTSGSFFISGDR